MKIVLVAHNKKRELMVDFCIAYKVILAQHDLFSTEETGVAVAEATRMDVHRFSHYSLGGEQQIGARIALNEIDMLIFFRDIPYNYNRSGNENSLLDLCDGNNIPFATNIATAEVLIKGLERGDLAWRELVNSSSIL